MHGLLTQTDVLISSLLPGAQWHARGPSEDRSTFLLLLLLKAPLFLL